jgi:endonuclease/exonuclease/phosphatase (EEP) superfamily protein YafD
MISGHRSAMPRSPAASGHAKTAVLLLTLAISLPLIAGFLGRLHPALDAFSHFRAHLGVLLAGAALLLLATRQWLHGIVALALALGALATAPGMAGSAAAGSRVATDEARYSLLHLNLGPDLGAPQRLISLIGRTRPDVVVLVEASRSWLERLEIVFAVYPHHLHCPAPQTGSGVLILSRRPFLDDGACGLGGRLGRARIDFGGRTVDIAGMHLLWPWPFPQPAQVEEALPVLAALGDEALLTGDFNAVDWSASVRRIFAGGGFAEMPALGSTWLPRGAPEALRRWVGLPIDHVLAKRGVALLGARKLEGVGSDHLPVLVEFTLRPQPAIGDIAVAGLASGR